MTVTGEAWVASALLIGLFGSVHCLGMCGGIAGALGQALPRSSPGRDWARATRYSVGRISSYAVAGAGVGLLGGVVSDWTGVTVGLRVAAALLILAFGLHVSGIWNGLAGLERLGLGLWRRIAPLARRLGRPDRAWKILLIGGLWGWLPCGLVYSALAASATSGTAAGGAAFMLCFGLGTLPALLAASGLGMGLGDRLALRSTRRAAGVLLLVFGLWSLAGALMPLLGHGAHGADPKPGHAAHAAHAQDDPHAPGVH